MSSRFRVFWRDRRANFTVMFALSAPVVVIFVGMGIDYLVALSNKSRWDTAADAAALAAVQYAEAYVTNNASSQTTAALSAGAIAAGEAQGYKVFNANAGASEAAETVNPLVTVTISGATFNATVTFTGSVGTHFGGLLDLSTLAVAGASAATASMTTYLNYYIVVDTSQSMGIGATQTDETNLYNVTKAMGYEDDSQPGCVFGCHVATYGRPLSNEQVAHAQNPPITLRIDSAKTAIQDVITQAQSYAGSAGNIKIGLYTMQLNPSSGAKLTTVSSPSNNYTQLASLASSIDLGPNTTAGLGDSDMVDSLTALSQIVPANGNGWSASTPINYVLVITDGVVDISGPCNADSHCTGAIPTTACSALQANATVGVVYTTYLTLYDYNNSAYGYEPDYSLLVLPFASNIEPNLEACASNANLFFEASDASALVSAMQNLFQSTLQSARLTQ